MCIYLYHKRHTITGLNYFGKTRRDPTKYLGSGLHWVRHLKKHGRHVENVEVWKFDDLDECSKFAVEFSTKHNIVESSEWANLKIENGRDGGFDKLSKESIEKSVKTRKANGSYVRNASAQEKRRKTMIERYGCMTTTKGIARTEDEKKHISQKNSGRKHTAESRQAMSVLRQGSKNAVAKLTELQALEIKESPDSTIILAKRFNISRSLVYKIKDGTAWKHI